MKVAATMKSHEIKSIERMTLRATDIMRDAREEHIFTELDKAMEMCDMVLGTIENIGLYQEVTGDPEQEIVVSTGDLLCMKDCLTTAVWIAHESGEEHQYFNLFGAQMYLEMAWEYVQRARRTL